MAPAPTPIESPAPGEVAAITAIPDSTIRNLRITECYYRLSAAMAQRTGGGANWCTFATWASKQAGQTIRGEDLFQHFAQHARRGWSLLHPIQSVWRVLLRRGIFNPETSLGRVVKGIHTPFDAFERASDAVARGNRKVFEEIGWEFARYLHACPANAAPDSAEFAAFAGGLKAGPPPDGQDLLRQAFSHYQQHAFETSPAARAQLLLLANLKIGLHEQTRLQPEILEAIEAAPDTVKDLRERRLFFRAPAAFLARGYAKYARELTRRAITDSLMVLTLPDSVHRLGAHIPIPFPPDLEKLDAEELRAFWDDLEPNRPECADCGAKDWTSLAERMHYVLHLFRCFHSQPALLAPPFGEDQVRAMMAGKVPRGKL